MSWTMPRTCSSRSGMTMALPGTFSARVADAHLDAVLPGEGELAVVVLAGAGVLGLLDHHDLVAVHLAGQGDGGGQARVARGAALEALQLGQQLGDVEDLALGDELVLVHVAQAAGRVARARPRGRARWRRGRRSRCGRW